MIKGSGMTIPAPPPPATPKLPVMASMRQQVATVQWLSTDWSPMPLPILMPMGFTVPMRVASSLIFSTGTPVMGEAHSGVYCFMCSANSSKPLHQFATKSWS